MRRRIYSLDHGIIFVWPAHIKLNMHTRYIPATMATPMNIYIIAAVPYNGLCAIGKAADCDARFDQLLLVSPSLDLYYQSHPTQDANDILVKLRAQYADRQLDGEWYCLSIDELNEFIGANTVQPSHQIDLDLLTRGKNSMILAQEAMITRLNARVSELTQRPPDANRRDNKSPDANRRDNKSPDANRRDNKSPNTATERANAWIYANPPTLWEGFEAYYIRYCASHPPLTNIGIGKFDTILQSHKLINIHTNGVVKYLSYSGPRAR